MNNHQSERLDSWKMIVSESKNNPESVAMVPKFGIAITGLEEIIAKITSLHLVQGKDLTGITANKLMNLENLVNSTVEISGAIYSYATDKNDLALKAVVDYKSSSLMNIPQSEVLNIAGIVLEEAKKLAPADLAQEGITAEELTDFESLIDYLKENKTANREAVIDRSDITAQINALFKQGAEMVSEKLDRLSVQFKRKAPSFYLKYKAARTVTRRRGGQKNNDNEDEDLETPKA
jgi:hypothetical protein